jgi:hypothetical protein
MCRERAVGDVEAEDVEIAVANCLFSLSLNLASAAASLLLRSATARSSIALASAAVPNCCASPDRVLPISATPISPATSTFFFMAFLPSTYRNHNGSACICLMLDGRGMPRPCKRQGKRERLIGASSRLAVLRVPVALQIGDQSGAEMAVGLLARVDGEIGAERIERLLPYAQRTPVPCGAHHT